MAVVGLDTYTGSDKERASPWSAAHLQPTPEQLRPRHTEASYSSDLHGQVTQRIHQPNGHIEPIC
jgi:hypothetical protein